MRSRSTTVVMAAIAATLTATPASAGSLRVEPVLVDVAAPGAASTLTLRNESALPVNAQVRVYRWRQVNGQEALEPTTEVVASPPALTVSPKVPYVVRVIRVAKGPVVAEESYRVVVDQLPDAAQQHSGTVRMVLRHSIPAFFRPEAVSGPALDWSLGRSGGATVLSAHNKGDRRLRLSALRVGDVSLGNGLVGYVLAGSSMRWTVPGGGRALSGNAVRIVGQGDLGPIDANARLAGP